MARLNTLDLNFAPRTHEGAPRQRRHAAARCTREMSATLSPVRTSDADLMRALHDQHAAALWSYVVGLTGGDRARAQDVVQETMLRAWRTPAVLNQAQGSVRGWLYTVARRIVIDEWRTTRSHR